MNDADAGSGVYINIEGVDGSGKTTQARMLADALGAVLTRETGGTVLGVELRKLLLSDAPCPLASAFIAFADRAQHMHEIVRPALISGRHVVSDRGAVSTVVYQGFGEGVPRKMLTRHNRRTVGDLLDLTVVLCVSPSVARTRIGDPNDRYETDAMQQKVARGYAAVILDPQIVGAGKHLVTVDGEGTPEDVHIRVRAVVSNLLGV
jgi:dTMP kinase